jgi:hypothetical protein
LIGTKALLTDDPAADDTAKFKASCAPNDYLIAKRAYDDAQVSFV